MSFVICLGTDGGWGGAISIKGKLWNVLGTVYDINRDISYHPVSWNSAIVIKKKLRNVLRTDLTIISTEISYDFLEQILKQCHFHQKEA